MALHEGKRVLRDANGRLYKVPVAEAERTMRAKGWTDASEAEVSARSQALAEKAKFGGVGQQALALAERAGRTVTLGALPTSGEEKRRAAVLEQESPWLSLAASAAGSLVPGAAAGGLARAAGAGAAGVAAAEGLAIGAAEETDLARNVQQRDVSVGNVLMFGLGGELAGRAVPALLRRGLRPLAPSTDTAARVAGDAAEDLTQQASGKARQRAAREAADLPDGPARDQAIAETADQQRERIASELAEAAAEGDNFARALDEAADESIDRLVSADAPAQTQWATDTARELRDAAARAEESAADAAYRAPEPGGDAFADDPRGIFSKSGRRAGSDAWKGNPAQAARYDRAIAEHGSKPEFVELLQQKAAETRRTPFGEGRERELWELQKDVLEENGALFPMRKSADAPGGGRMLKGKSKLGEARAAAGQVLHGKTLSSLGAVDDALDAKTLESLSKDEHFLSTGGVKDELGSSDNHIPQIVIEAGAKGQPDSVRLTNGRHRLSAARSAGMSSIEARIRKMGPRGAVIWDYRGPVSVGQASAPAPRAAPSPAPGSSAMERVALDLLDAKGGADTFRRARAGLRELEAAGAPAERVKAIRDGLKRRELWGDAAELEDALGRAREQGPATARAAAPAPPQQVADGLEALVDVGRRFGLLRGKLGRYAGVAVKARRASQDAAAVSRATAKTSSVGGEVAETIVDMGLGAMGVPPVAGLAWKLLVDGSARNAIKGAARRLLRPVEHVALDPSLARARVAAGSSALARFAGDYSTPEQAYEARRKMLAELSTNPAALPLALAQSTGDLARTDPALFQRMSGRVASQFAYVQANLPPAIGVSMLYPLGVPPSRDSLRDYAELWNSTFYPETVLDDLGAGTVSPTQMRVLRDVHPDLYEQVQAEVTFVAANSLGEIPHYTKQRLDILFDQDGVAGPCFSWRCADYMQEAQDDASQRVASSPVVSAPEEVAPEALGINAIRSGVTNRGA